MNRVCDTSLGEDAEKVKNACVHPGPMPSSLAPAGEKEAWTSQNECWRVWCLEELERRITWTDTASPKIVPNTANAAAFMRLHPDWHRVMVYDDFLQVSILNAQIPGSCEAAPVFVKRAVRDTDWSAAQEWFQKNDYQNL